ncbi:hypothetical protein CAI21_22185, partial [Alkalilimnicola ehrlichii]
MSYHGRYTWSHPLGEEVIAHNDGAVSLYIEWAGLDVWLADDTERAAKWNRFYRVLSRVGVEYTIEWHLWREYDPSVAINYYQYGEQNMLRGQEIGRAVRQAMVEHLAASAMSNTVGIVLTRLPAATGLGGRKRRLVKQAQLAQELRAQGAAVAKILGGEVRPWTDYLARIEQSYDRPAYAKRRLHEREGVPFDPLFQINEQIIREKPARDGEFLKLGDTYTKCLFLFLYPHADPAFFLGLAGLPCEMHVSHIVKPLHTRLAMRAADRSERYTGNLVGDSGQDYAFHKIRDLAGFKQFVVSNSLDIYDNAYLIHLHGSKDLVEATAEEITNWIEDNQGQVRSADYMQLPFFRYGQPGQGYKAPVMRRDHSWQVGNMLPVQVDDRGEEPESLRLSTSGQLTGFSVTRQKIPHGFTVAMTGGGKGVDTVATIAESYPCGTDWYIMEIGGSYQWIVEGFGGRYIPVDPNEHGVNPLPAFSMAKPITGDDPDALPLDARLAGGTTSALALVLSGGRMSLDQHQEAAAEMALQMMYAAPDLSREAPVLPDYLQELRGATYFDNDAQAKAAQNMADNLESFLSTAQGRAFSGKDNLVLSKGICAVDLKPVLAVNKDLIRFYLVFLSLKLSHLAF